MRPDFKKEIRELGTGPEENFVEEGFKMKTDHRKEIKRLTTKIGKDFELVNKSNSNLLEILDKQEDLLKKMIIFNSNIKITMLEQSKRVEGIEGNLIKKRRLERVTETNIIKKPEQEISDTLKLFDDILSAKCNISDDNSTIGQLIRDDSYRINVLKTYGIKILYNEIDDTCDKVFLRPDIIRKKLLKGTIWEKISIKDILIRHPEAIRDRKRITEYSISTEDKNRRGITIPMRVLFLDKSTREYIKTNEHLINVDKSYAKKILKNKPIKK